MRALVFLLVTAAYAQSTTVEGVVTSSSDSTTVKKALVTLYSEGGSSTYQAITDAIGRFRLDSVRPGKYLPMIQAVGFSPARLPVIAAEPGKATVNVNFVIEPLGVISGRVFDENGQPLRGAEVDSMLETYSQQGREFRTASQQRTNDLGEYRLFGLAPGIWQLNVHKDRLPPRPVGHIRNPAPQEIYIPDTLPGTIEVTAGANITGVDFHLRRARVWKIKGRVIDDRSGEPAAAYVTIQGVRGAGIARGGTFEIRDNLPGSYRLTATLNGAVKETYSSGTVVIVSDRDVEGVTIHCSPTFALRGTLTGRRSGVVMLDPLEAGKWGVSASVLADGSFTLAGLAPGAYQVKVSSETGLYMQSLRFAERDISEDARIDVAPGSGPLSIALGSDTGQIEGTVIAAERAGPLTATLAPEGRYAARRDFLFHTGVSQTTGRFQFAGVPPGNYTLFVWELPTTELAAYADFRRSLAGRGLEVTVRPAERVTLRTEPISKAELRDAVKRMSR